MVIEYPFRHIVIDGMLTEDEGRAARSEFDLVADHQWRRFDNSRERKAQAPFKCGGPSIHAIATMLRSDEFIDRIGELFNIDGLSFDDLGGGLHRIEPGGLLDIHVDFNRHNDGRYRRVNALLYLNDDPHPSADLLLAPSWPCDNSQLVRVRPTMGRLVLFQTSEQSWHGHPQPLQGDERRSLAAYYYTDTPPPDAAAKHSTIFATNSPPW